MKDCKDCLHYEACKGTYYTAKGCDNIALYDFDGEMYADSGCEDFTDRSEWVHLPCEVGSHIFVRRKNKIIEMEVKSIIKSDFKMLKSFYDIDGDILVCAISGDCYDCTADRFGINEFGETVFLSREAAEKALEGKK